MPRATEKVRLEQGEGDSRLFWEITRDNKTTFTIRRGRHLNAGRKTVKTFASAASSKQAWNEAIAHQRNEGYGEPTPRKEQNVVGTSSKAGVSVTNPTLEALIEEEPNDPQRYLVYADWLQQQGDPRGELIIIQQRLSTAELLGQKELEALDQMEEELLTKFEEELTGFFGRYTHFKYLGRARGLAWRCGFIRAAHLAPIRLTGQHDVPEILEMLLENPSGRFLEYLVLGNCNLTTTCDVLRTKGAPATLHTLVIGEGILNARNGSIAPIWSALPRLRRLVLDVSIAELGCTSAEGIAELHVTFGGPATLAAISKAEWPTLKRLHVTVADARMNVNEERSLSNAIDRMPALEHLTVRQWHVDSRMRPIAKDALALETVRIAVAKKLRCLDLEVPMSTSAGNLLHKQLLAAREALRVLRIPTRAIVDKTLRTALTPLPGLEWTDVPDEVNVTDIEPFHHAPTSAV